jgi:preprotein translocase subunit SecG
MLDGLIMFLLLVTSVFLILLVLIQRGRGGGLAGAFGGLGGQSAFGTKAGDLFTRITIFVAAFWIILCAVSVKYFSESGRAGLAPNLGKTGAATTGASGGKSAADTKAGAAGGKSAAPSDASGAATPAATAPAAAAPEAAPAASTSAPAESTPAPAADADKAK